MRTFICLLLVFSTLGSIAQEMEEEIRSLLPGVHQSSISKTEFTEEELVPADILFLFSLRRYDFLDLVFPLSPFWSKVQSRHIKLFLGRASNSYSNLLRFSLLDIPPPFLS